ncbi:hypothetical protein ANCCEY_03229 [Ancylostoma ceylanicum]|uniref:Uncharacterized protein n=1 Tax=Ancylostoma ceylanicum TaxID=53326 RepID=A0A0D6M094_9BILA|nr:hypothetical protein ANCCEY_03229 [Ancylostoma ceylanicum]
MTWYPSWVKIFFALFSGYRDVVFAEEKNYGILEPFVEFFLVFGVWALSKADDLIKAEMARLVAWDVQNNVPNEVYEENDLKNASELIKKDCDVGPPLDASMWAVIEQCSTELVQIRGKFTRIAVLNRGEQIEALHSQFQIYRDWMNARAKKTGKLEKKLKIKLGGYQHVP